MGENIIVPSHESIRPTEFANCRGSGTALGFPYTYPAEDTGKRSVLPNIFIAPL